MLTSVASGRARDAFFPSRKGGSSKRSRKRQKDLEKPLEVEEEVKGGEGEKEMGEDQEDQEGPWTYSGMGGGPGLSMTIPEGFHHYFGMGGEH